MTIMVGSDQESSIHSQLPRSSYALFRPTTARVTRSIPCFSIFLSDHQATVQHDLGHDWCHGRLQHEYLIVAEQCLTLSRYQPHPKCQVGRERSQPSVRARDELQPDIRSASFLAYLRLRLLILSSTRKASTRGTFFVPRPRVISQSCPCSNILLLCIDTRNQHCRRAVLLRPMSSPCRPTATRFIQRLSR